MVSKVTDVFAEAAATFVRRLGLVGVLERAWADCGERFTGRFVADNGDTAGKSYVTASVGVRVLSLACGVSRRGER